MDILSRGYATATTDMGHQRQFGPRFSFARNNRQGEINFGSRSARLTTVMANIDDEGIHVTVGKTGKKLVIEWIDDLRDAVKAAQSSSA